jgi:hypothetical protein
MTKEQKKAFFRKHGLEYEWGMGTLITVDSPIRYIHSGDDFLRVQTDQGTIFFRWSQVCSYSCEA